MTEQPSALITGVTGQDGSYLAEFLLGKGYKIIKIIHHSNTITFKHIHQIGNALRAPITAQIRAVMLEIIERIDHAIQIYSTAL